jgi:endonuclease G
MVKPKTDAFSIETLLHCRGFDTGFIEKKTKLSLDKILSPARRKLLPKVKGNKSKILNYSSLSVLYNSKRRLPFFAACNIDGANKQKNAPKPPFRADPRINEGMQLDKSFYSLKKTGKPTVFQIGHMASNNEMGRGQLGPLQAAQTFHFTNAAPQAGRLNAGLWKGLESYIIKHAATLKDNKRICVFTGPVLASFDPGFKLEPSFKVPLLFFKVIVFPTASGVYSTAFILSHEKKLLNDGMLIDKDKQVLRGPIKDEELFFADYPYKQVFQVNMSELKEVTGLDFSWPNVKQISVPGQKRRMEKIKKVENAKDARAIVRVMRGPLDNIKMKTSAKDVTDKELKSNNYFLTMVLPV